MADYHEYRIYRFSLNELITKKPQTGGLVSIVAVNSGGEEKAALSQHDKITRVNDNNQYGSFRFIVRL